MKICIFGVGRSGTTSLYALIQEALRDAGIGRFSYYEPFLWGPRTWNQPYVDVSRLLNSMQCLHPLAMAAHAELPMLISNPAQIQVDDYLTKLLHLDEPTAPCLWKFIRANGRWPLIRQLIPDAKFVFILRNPLDVLNSSLGKFSFYGEGFHPSDVHRFKAELIAIYPDESERIDSLFAAGPASQQLAYWYYMNRFAVEQILALPPTERPHVIVFEDWHQRREVCLNALFNHLGIPVLDRHTIVASRPVGHTTSGTKLNQVELDLIIPWMNTYAELVQTVAPHVKLNLATRISHHSKPARTTAVQFPTENYTANFTWSRYQDALHEQAHINERFQTDLVKANRRISHLDTQIIQLSDRNNELTVLTGQLTEQNTKLTDTEARLKDRLDHLTVRSRDLSAKLSDANSHIAQLEPHAAFTTRLAAKWWWRALERLFKQWRLPRPPV